jgi:DNA helicase-2/ATP-dependent DNA helicase PcrA
MRPSPTEELNPAQQSAVHSGLSPSDDSIPGPLLVIAGAGTGKTKTLAHRVAALILAGVRPERILLMTFARRMAVEMERRVERICAAALGSGRDISLSIEWAGTFHAIGAKLLRLHAQQIGLDPAFSILDRADAEDLMDLVRDDLGLSRTARRFPKKGTCLAIYSHALNAQRALRDTLQDQFPWCSEWEDALKKLFSAYVEAKQHQSVLDYDDLLLYWGKMMEIGPVARLVSSRFDHVLVDEYQDTNALQAAILLALKPDGRGVTVVGDDAQSIYAFRSANVRNILDFPGRYEKPATVVTLEQNYRSTQPILDACNRVIGRATERYTKNLFSRRPGGSRPVIAMVDDESAQASFVVDRILADREVGIGLRDQAVLFRASHHSASVELELARRNVPFIKFGGLKFLEAAHVKDVIALLRWAENPRDQVAAFRILKLLPGVGPATARQAVAAVVASGGSLSSLRMFRPPSGAATAWQEMVELMTDLASASQWDGQLQRLRIWYDPMLAALYESPRARLGDLDQLERMAGEHRTRASFLTDLSLDPPEASGDEAGVPAKDEEWLTLSTIHSAKGQEWKAVTILNVVDGCIPSDLATGTPEELEEERRLLYVAMTRAKDHLVLMQPLRFYVKGQSVGGNKHVYAPRTRFIAEVDLALFEVVGRSSEHGVARGEQPAYPAIDLKSEVRLMWG